jgi:hypothetical protein
MWTSIATAAMARQAQTINHRRIRLFMPVFVAHAPYTYAA